MSPLDAITSIDGPWVLTAFASDFWNMLTFTAVVFLGGVALGRFSKNGLVSDLQNRVNQLGDMIKFLGVSPEMVERVKSGGSLTREDVVEIMHEEFRPATAEEIYEMFGCDSSADE